MPFAPGDLVHVASVGKGTVREARNSGSYLVEVQGRSIVTTEDRLTPQQMPRKSGRRKTAVSAPAVDDSQPPAAPPSIDLHGHTVEEALEAIDRFLNAALLGGSHEARIIHGRSGGRIKAALHAHLRGIPSIRGFALDPRN